MNKKFTRSEAATYSKISAFPMPKNTWSKRNWSSKLTFHEGPRSYTDHRRPALGHQAARRFQKCYAAISNSFPLSASCASS